MTPRSMLSVFAALLGAVLLINLPGQAQNSAGPISPVALPISAGASATPPLVKFSGAILPASGTPATVGVTFSLYKDQNGGAPLWLETQNVNASASGAFTVYLGANHAGGIPAELFATGEARWLGVQPEGQGELPRVLLVSVPYALKAADADTLGGRPASSYVTSEQIVNQFAVAGALPAQAAPGATGTVTVPKGVEIGPRRADPKTKTRMSVSSALDFYALTPCRVVDTRDASGPLGGPALSPNTQRNFPMLESSCFPADPNTAVAYSLNVTVVPNGATLGYLSIWPAGTSQPVVSTLNDLTGLILANAAIVPAGTDLNGSVAVIASASAAIDVVIDVNGYFAAASSGGGGTITGVTAGTDLTGGGASGTVTLNLDTTKVPTLAANNVFTNSQNIDISGLDGIFLGNINCGTIPGIGFYTTPDGCAGYSIAGGDGNTYINRSSGKQIVFREANTTEMTLNAGGGLKVSAPTPQPSSNGTTGLSATGGADNTGKYTPGAGVSGTGGAANGASGACETGSCGGGSGVVGTGGSDNTSNRLGFGGDGVDGYAGSSPSQGGNGGMFVASSEQSTGVYGSDGGATQSYAGYFQGDVGATGTFTGSLVVSNVDHPLDPANKYLRHASVGSSEMINIYTGNVTTDSSGEAVVELPDWFQALNADFRYQLTVIGQFAQAIVSSKIANNQFSIRTDKPDVEVSWQVTGVRQDAFAKAHPLQVEEEKAIRERGYYNHPELYGAPEEKQIEWARHPHTMQQIRDHRNTQANLLKNAAEGGNTPAPEPH